MWLYVTRFLWFFIYINYSSDELTTINTTEDYQRFHSWKAFEIGALSSSKIP